MKPIKTSSDGHAFLPLGQIEYEIFARRTRCGLPVFRDPAAFSEQLKTLAAWHADQVKPLRDEERKKRYQAVAKAVHLLQETLLGLKPDEIKWLLSEENRYLSSGTLDAAANEPDDEQLWAELNIEPAQCHEHVLIVRDMHNPDTREIRDRFFDFLSGWLGGPQRFIEKHGHPRLRARHLPFSIGKSERDQWLHCMNLALDDTPMDAELRAYLKDAFAKTGDFLRNRGES